MADPVLKIVQHGNVRGETLSHVVHESASDAATGLVKDLEHQLRYGRITDYPICVELMPMRIGDDSFYVGVVAFVMSRSDYAGDGMLKAFGSTLRSMRRESANLAETVIEPVRE